MDGSLHVRPENQCLVAGRASRPLGIAEFATDPLLLPVQGERAVQIPARVGSAAPDRLGRR